MHELSIAQNILEIVHQYVPDDRRGAVKSIRLRIGDLAGVVPDSLDFCFSSIIAETALRKASLDIERVPYTLHCPHCDLTFTGEFGIVLCPKCGSDTPTVIGGTEMQVVEIELLENGSG